MIWGHHSKNHINLSKKFSLFIDFFHPRNLPLFLHRTTIRLLLLVRELESLILTFLNLYVTLHKILYHRLRLVNFPFLLDLHLLGKELSILCNNIQFYDEFIWRTSWFTISDFHSRTKFVTSTSTKVSINNFILNWESDPTNNKGEHLVYLLLPQGSR